MVSASRLHWIQQIRGAAGDIRPKPQRTSQSCMMCCPICRAPMRWVHRHGITQYLYFPAMTVRLSLQEAAAADCGEGGCCLCGPAGCRQQQAHRAQQAGGQHQGVCAPQHKAPARGTPWRGCRRLGCCWWRPAPWRHQWVVTAEMPLSCPMAFSDCVCNDATDVPRGVFDVQQTGLCIALSVSVQHDSFCVYDLYDVFCIR